MFNIIYPKLHFHKITHLREAKKHTHKNKIIRLYASLHNQQCNFPTNNLPHKKKNILNENLIINKYQITKVIFFFTNIF